MADSKGPRLYHKKSRSGCQRCKARRVKCDEGRPVCGSCGRHNVSCDYESRAATIYRRGRDSRDRPPGPEAAADASRSVDLGDDGDGDGDGVVVPESKPRRLLELRLLQHYLLNTCQTLPGTHDAEVRETWAVDVPRLAYRHEPLLYGILSVAALHLARSSSPAEASDLLAARRGYQDLAIREHRRAVARLNTTSADAVCFTSILVGLDAFAVLQYRPLEPYAPPTQWLHMASGAGSVFRAAWAWVEGDETFKVMVLVRAAQVLRETSVLFCAENRARFPDLLGRCCGDDDESWDAETREAYENTIDYVGSVHAALEAGEHALAIARRLMAFATLIPKRFIELVEERRPRGLVVLAHYFALAAKLGPLWWLGDTARREVCAIQKVLPAEWQGMMRWPLETVGMPLE